MWDTMHPGTLHLVSGEITTGPWLCVVDRQPKARAARPRRIARPAPAAASIPVPSVDPIDPNGQELRALSPDPIEPSPRRQAIQFLSSMYRPDEFVYIGNGREGGWRQRRAVRKVSEWIGFLETTTLSDDELGRFFPYIIANPLTGSEGLTKSGTPSYRSDSCVASYRYAVVEFDSLAKPMQVALDLNLFKDSLACLIDSAGKSVHAWVRVDLATADQWEAEIETALYGRIVPMGADPMCKNEARLSRLPGMFREEKGMFQRLLWMKGI